MIEHDRSKCKSLLGYLSEYIDGDLGQDLCEEIEHHLAECHDCHIVVDTLRKTVSLYHDAASEPAEVPEIVRERLFRTLNLDDYIHH